MKIPTFVVLQIATILICSNFCLDCFKSYSPGRKSLSYVYVIEITELSSYPSQRSHRYTADLLGEQHIIIGSQNHLADGGLSTDSDIL